MFGELSFSSYKKNSEYIICKVSSLDLYEVDANLMHKYRLFNDVVEFRNGIQTYSELNKEGFNLHQIYDPFQRFRFLFLASGPNLENMKKVDGKLYRLLFEPEPILKAVNLLLQYVDCYSNPAIKEYQEEENLLRLKLLLEKTIEFDGLISCTEGG